MSRLPQRDANVLKIRHTSLRLGEPTGHDDIQTTRHIVRVIISTEDAAHVPAVGSRLSLFFHPSTTILSPPLVFVPSNMADQLKFPPADFSIPLSHETQNSEIVGAGNVASSPMHWSDFGTIPPLQLPDPAHPLLTGNYGSGPRDNLHGATDLRSPQPLWPPMQRNTPTSLPFPLTDPSYDHLSYPIHPRLAPNQRINDLDNGTGVPPLQAAMHVGERFLDALPWLTTGTERNGVALINGIAHQLGLHIHIVPALPPVTSAPSQPFPNSPTTHSAPTLPESGGAGTGPGAEIPMSHAVQITNPYPAHIAAEQPQRFPSLSIAPGATPLFHGGTSRLSRMLVEPTPPSEISSTLPTISQCGPGHELQSFQREHDTNPSSSIQGGAPVGPYHPAGYGQYPAIPTDAANTVPMASKRRRAPSGVREPELCSECEVTNTPQWRRHPDNNSRLCNSCGQKAHSKKRNKSKNGKHTPSRKLQQHR
ncbi:hypothetical protein MVEN_00623100 [Mycena venus]|uniref:GATA-type domain-containing protein n=1 Tax=Mycena venus TaxID=2733690 RepID=A0A8H6YML2_9AGAR|nr:hypothetical protein MVEN_00623100 [Mycena venus]